MANLGRPRVLDEAKRREICALVSAGAGVRQAAQYVGCSQSTICREAQRNQAFREQLRRAKATTHLAPLQAMRQAMQSSWRAAAWMLERADPQQYGRSQRNAFGRRELKALARDLMAIFHEEIDHPGRRKQVAKRVQATINYAMRHAWDTNRTGKSLSKAMDYFAKKQEADEAWGEFHFSLDRLDEMPLAPSLNEQGFASPKEGIFAKAESTEDARGQITTEISDPTDNAAA